MRQIARWGARAYFAFFGSPFFTPASGKIHIATTMNTAVMMTKVEKSGRIGEPLHHARTAATIRTTTETAALTSLGMASAPTANANRLVRPPPHRDAAARRAGSA